MWNTVWQIFLHGSAALFWAIILVAVFRIAKSTKKGTNEKIQMPEKVVAVLFDGGKKKVIQ